MVADALTSDHGSRLWDLGDGTAQLLVGEIVPSHINAIDFTSDGRLFGVGSSTLWSISVDTGEGTQVGGIGQHIVSLAFSDADTLYGGTIAGGIFAIDAASGGSQFLADSPVELVSALAYNPTGRLLGFGRDFTQPESESVFFELDPQSLGDNILGKLSGASNLESLDYGADGLLYGWDNQSLYTVDLSTRHATLVNNFGSEPSGQAMAVLNSSAVPEPSTIAIWSLLIAIGFGYGWKKRL